MVAELGAVVVVVAVAPFDDDPGAPTVGAAPASTNSIVEPVRLALGTRVTEPWIAR